VTDDKRDARRQRVRRGLMRWFWWMLAGLGAATLATAAALRSGMDERYTVVYGLFAALYLSLLAALLTIEHRVAEMDNAAFDRFYDVHGRFWLRDWS
jgi:hypothetical protein